MSQNETLWKQVLDWSNLLLAWRKARKGKTNHDAVRAFGFNLEYELADIRRELREHTYLPGPFRQFTVRDRKIRLISAAPFRDRVVQHALLNVVGPILNRRFIRDSYASQVGKGVHLAVRRYQHWANRYTYALKLDVQRYFDSMDHRLLHEKLARALDDADVLWLFDCIIDSSPEPLRPCPVPGPGEDLVDLMERRTGLPLGNLTSQFFGNLYLDDFDHKLKETLGISAYLRYVDDFIVLGDDKAQLRSWGESIERLLAKERLKIHPSKKLLIPVRCGLDVLGYRVFPHSIRLSRGSGYRFQRRLKAWALEYGKGNLELADVEPRIAGWIGHAVQADSLQLRRKILNKVYFVRGGAAR